MKNKKIHQIPMIKYTDFVYGVHAVLELLVAKRRKIGAIYTTNHPIKSWNQIKRLLPDYVQVHTVSRETLSKMADSDDHQGILAYVAPFPYQKQIFDPIKHSFVLVLDGIQDVRNLGAIVRSAYCAGVDGIVLTRKGGAPINAAAIKASAGLAEHVQVYVAATSSEAVIELGKKGYHIYLATLGKGENAATMKFDQPAALVIGSEETGVSSSILKSGTRVLLPQRRPDISYNASVAAGILMFLIGSQIQKI
jgi:23S rRNA (guanosine2251-2'-O)-methyltransferase